MDLSTAVPPVMLLTRAWPHSDAAAGFDQWQRARHIPEIVSSGQLTYAQYFTALDEGIPPAWIAPGLRMAVYHAARFSDLAEWMTSPNLASALSDGERWFGSFHRLDGAPFTGNIYCGPGGLAFDGRGQPDGGAVIVDRWQQPPGDFRAVAAAEAGYLAALRELPGVRSAARWTGATTQAPVRYYRSLGDQLIWTEFDSAAALRDALGSDQFVTAASLLEQALSDADSIYLTHEAYEHAFTVSSVPS
jgi:hypothetical protein